jgi:ADP-dependent NAD(P)H-hydrate dehydratase / NAD(P)H-hydrate epimerase
VLCGKGNNGGDGFVVARRLLDLGPTVYLVGTRADVRGDARLHLGVFERSGGAIEELASAADWESRRERALGADLIVDALLGTGLNQQPSGLVGQVIADLASSARQRSRPLVAVDIPSGIASDTGELAWATVEATLTVTFAAPKYGHVLPPACDRVGELMVTDIGIPRSLLETAELWLLERNDAARVYTPRRPDAHKGGFGHVLVVAGSVGKTGAAILSGSAALRAGAGLVTVATPAPALPMVAAGPPELMTEALPTGSAGTLQSEAISRALTLAEKRDAMVLGPGLGQGAETREFVRQVVRRSSVPLIVDADGLNALAASPRVPAGLDALRRDRPTVLTPHPGEMARLVGHDTKEVQRRRLEMARALALETGAVVVLKGHRTLVADGSGRTAVNPTGNPGMATGGTGDVLSGMIGALLARGIDAWTAATAAVFLHGTAGDRAAARRGQEGMIAGDLIEALPETLRALEDGHS